jgi:hypothetical protein
VMGACEKVIRVTGISRPARIAKTPTDRPGDGQEPALEASRNSAPDASEQGETIRQRTYLSGGGLSIAPGTQTSPVAPAVATEPSPQQSGNLLGSPRSGVNTGAAAAQPGKSGTDSPEPGKLEAAGGRPLSSASTTMAAGSSGRGPSPWESRTTRAPNDRAQTDIMELARQLRSDDQKAANEALLELQRRGFNEVQLEVARQLFDPDPEIRRQLVRTLPQLRSVNSTPWLFWLCHDTDPEVRLLAVTLLATTNDPTILAQVEGIARADSDPRVQDQAFRIARHRTVAEKGEMRDER